jgi:phage terminase Nu1 subunit (DNA packaging protein)
MTERISPAEYSRRRGCSRKTVSVKIKAGIITVIDGTLDPVLADQQWDSGIKQLHPLTKNNAAYDAVKKSAAISYDFHQSRAKRETHEADLSELKLRQRAGELVEVAEVTYALTDYGATLKSLIQQWPDRLAPVLAHETDVSKINAILKTECNQLIDELRDLAIKIAGLLKNESSERT